MVACTRSLHQWGTIQCKHWCMGSRLYHGAIGLFTSYISWKRQSRSIRANIRVNWSSWCCNIDADGLHRKYERTTWMMLFFLYWESFHQDVLARLQQLPNYPPQDFNVRFALGHEHPRATARTQLTSEGTQTYRWIYYILFGFFSGIQFLRYLLDVDPSKRPSAAEAIGKYFQAEKEKRIFCLFLPVAHPYLTSLHEPVDEPVTEVLNDPHSNENHSINTWKSKLTIFYFEIFSFFCLDIIWTMVEEFLPPSWITEDSSEDE